MLLAATSQVSAKTPTPPAPKPPAHIHQGKITPAERQAAAQRAAKARAASGEMSAQAAYAAIPGEADYFGLTPNYAISPIPASTSIIGDGLGAIYTPVLTGDTVTSFVLAVPATATTPGSVGSGYSPAATTIEVVGGGHTVDGLGRTGCIGIPTFSVAPFTAMNPAGAITAITPSGTCSGFDAAHGIRKFVDSLPLLNSPNNLGNQMTVAVPTTMTVNGVDSDFYEIHLKDFPWQFNSSLPATTVRGYFQVLPSGPVAYSYLGPVIVAQQNRPVRIKFVNELPLGSGGNLFIPVDETVMGAGMGPTGGMYTQSRAELHLHGGVTPWISDGTPHQWTTPAGSTAANTAYPEGVSVVNVPDMDGGTEPIGTLTYYYTNQQSARLMFYHDHTFGITRLNVYAGEAAAYVVQDNFESMLATGKALDGATTTLTGTGAAATATVVGGAVTAITLDTDPVTGKVLAGANYTSAPSVSFSGGGTPTQAASAVAYMSAGKVTSFAVIDGGAGYSSAPSVVIGTTTFSAVAGTIPDGNIPLVIQDRTFVDTQDILRTDPTWPNIGMPMIQGSLWYPHIYMPNQNPADMMGVNNMGRWDWGPWFWPPAPVNFAPLPNPYAVYAAINPSEGPTIPSTPNPSIVPEGYMDTPVINGTAYPTLTVEPKAVRFRILNAANDRYLNLSLFCAADQSATPMWSGTALTNGLAGEVKMVPAAPGMGLPSGWPTDGRDGGVPDPAAAGPDIIQIGTEGGFLPDVAHRPAQPVGYEYNRRSITVLNVQEKGLYLGPAERADVIVDFSTAPAGCNRLILYNDAPAPMPAFDPRNDYYTYDPDNTATGGAPSTQLGYGPNTRTLMQINISGASAAFNEAPLVAALPQVFAATQDKPIVPQPDYNNAMGYSAPTTNYARIGDMSMSFFNGPVTRSNFWRVARITLRLQSPSRAAVALGRQPRPSSHRTS